MPSSSARLVWAVVGRVAWEGFMRFRDMAVLLLYGGVYATFTTTTATSVCCWWDGGWVTWNCTG